MLNKTTSHSEFNKNSPSNLSTGINISPNINNPLAIDDLSRMGQASSFDFGLDESTEIPTIDPSPINPNWVKTIGSRGFEAGYDIAVDNQGNVFTIGEFRNSIDLDGDGETEVSAGGGDIFIIKQNALDGAVTWAKRIGGRSGDIGYEIAVDNNGDVYTTGYYQGSVDLSGDGTPETNAGFADAFILKHSGADGSVVWSRKLGGTNYDSGVAIAVDNNGHVYTTGIFNGSVDLNGDGTLEVSAGSGDVFVIKQNATDGNVAWTRRIGNSNYDYAYGIAVDNSGSVYVTGQFEGSLDVNGDNRVDLRSPSGGTSGFVVRYNADGSLNTLRQFAAAVYDIAVDNKGNVYVTGTALADGSASENPDEDVFLVKYNGSTNDIAWRRSLGSKNLDGGYAIALDSGGNIYVTGYFEGAADFDGDGVVETNAGGSDIFMTKHSYQDGKVLWKQTMGDVGADAGVGIAVDGGGDVYVTGYFAGSVDLNRDRTTETSVGNNDAFIVKFVTPNSGNSRHDFDGDGQADILLRNRNTGENLVQQVNATNFEFTNSGSIQPTISDASWQMITSGDFNGDGKDDMLWRNTSTGDNSIWLMNGLQLLAGASQNLTISAPIGWTIAATADFNGDGKDDILWRNQSTDENAVWFMDGFRADNQYLSIRNTTQAGWKMAGAGDMDGDGKADIVWRNELDGRNAIWLMDGKETKATKFINTITDQNWQIKAIGDTNGDRKADIIWQNSNNGEVAVWFVDTTNTTVNNEYSTDGKFIMNPTNSSARMQVPTGWEIETAANYDGNNKADLLWRNRSQGQIALWLMDSAEILEADFLTDDEGNNIYGSEWEIGF